MSEREETSGAAVGKVAGNGRKASARRALVVITEKVGGEGLVKSLLSRLDEDVAEVFVVAPAIADSALKHTMGDVDDAIPPARARLEATLEELRQAGLSANGEVGDSDPIQAINDELIKFEPEQIVVVAHRDEEGAFAEKGLLERAERDFDLPVLELVVDRGEQPEILDVKRSSPVAGRRKRGWRPSRNWPPLSKRDLAGIAVAILGTLILGALAADAVGSHDSAPDHEEGRLVATAAATILIALGMALVNLAHVVGLFLFQSVRYEGTFSRLFARLSLFGTPTAIVAALILGAVD
jgi:hypothetical protein